MMPREGLGEVRVMLAAEQQTRWKRVYAELARRQRVLKRALDKTQRIIAGPFTGKSGRAAYALMSGNLGTEIERQIYAEISAAFDRNAALLREHEKALPGLRDRDPRALLAPDPAFAGKARLREIATTRSRDGQGRFCIERNAAPLPPATMCGFSRDDRCTLSLSGDDVSSFCRNGCHRSIEKAARERHQFAV